MLASRFFQTLTVIHQLLFDQFITTNFDKSFVKLHSIIVRLLCIVTMTSKQILKKTIFIVKMCENVPEEIAKKGKELRSNLLPLKSKNAYEKVYVSFQDWKNKNRIKVGYRGKKSNVLTREEIKTFLQEADDGEYLFEKVRIT